MDKIRTSWLNDVQIWKRVASHSSKNIYDVKAVEGDRRWLD